MSTDPIRKKLKIADDALVALFGVPPEVDHVFAGLERDLYEPSVVFAFIQHQAALAEVAPHIISLYRRGQALWVAYPKKSGRLKSDMSRDVGWDPLKKVDLLPVMQIAIDDDWSALRWRYRDEIKHLTRRF